MQILLVSESPLALESMARALTGPSRTFQREGSGAAALEALTQTLPDAVVVDAVLRPDLALELLQRLRAVEGQQHIPLLAVMSSEHGAARLAALHLDADDVMTPPWDAAELGARLERALQLKLRVDGLIRAGEQLERLSFTDGLTQVSNHRYFQARLGDEFRRAQRYDDSLALILLDLDHFKAINDVHGHLTGDAVLREVAQALRKSLRETDVLSRYGGEEFAVMLPQTQLAGALTVAERIRADVNALRLGVDGELRVSASFGVAGFPSPSVTAPEGLIAAADAALYRAKNDGRNRICLAADSDDSHLSAVPLAHG